MSIRASSELSSVRGLKKKHLLLASVMLIVPALIFSIAIEQYMEHLGNSELNDNLSRSRLLMAELQGELSEENVLQNALNIFFRRLGDGLSEVPDPVFARQGNEMFFRKFSKRSKLLWFDSDFNFIVPEGSSVVQSRRVWQAFARSVFKPESMSSREKRQAEGFVKTSVSDFLDTEFFHERRARAIEIVFQGFRHYIAFSRFQGSSNQNSGYLIVMIPSHGVRKNWLPERAVRRASRRGALVGGIFADLNLVVKGSSISDNLLHGLLVDFRSGMQYRTQNEYFYYFKTAFNDPDLFLVTGLAQSSSFFYGKLLLYYLQKLLWLPSLICFLSILFCSRIEMPEISLRTRFRYAAMVLAISPVLLAVIPGYIYSARVALEEKQKSFRILEEHIELLEESVAQKTNDFEKYLSHDFPKQLLGARLDRQLADKLLEDLYSMGCEAVTFFLPDGQSFFSARLPPEKVKSRIAYQLSFIKIRLVEDGFDLEALQQSFPSPANSFNVDELRHDGPNYRLGMLGRFIKIEMGGRVFSSFSTYIRDVDGNILACISLGIDYRRLRQNLLLESAANIDKPGMKLFVASDRLNSVNILPKSDLLRNILNVSWMGKESFRFSLLWNNFDHLIISRQLKDLDNSAMIVWRQSNEFYTSEARQLAILVLFASVSFFMALMVLRFFDLLFLRPVLCLAEQATSVESGNYQLAERDYEANEVGQLQRNLDLMVVGLREKAAMKSFLRTDLVENVESSSDVVAEKIQATIIFAGIRQFSRFEEQLDPEKAMSAMNIFLSICSEEICRHGGETDKFIGDAAMGIFVKGDLSSSHLNAIMAAIDIIKRAGSAPELRGLEFGVGIASGEVIAGHVGSAGRRLDYTVIGDRVNLAARLEKMGSSGSNPAIIVSVLDMAELKKHFAVIELSPVRVKGKQEVIDICGIAARRNYQ